MKGSQKTEFCGLTKDDIDFVKNKIRVDHQLQRKRDMEYIIETPKTEKGVRYVPMSGEVSERFKRILENRKRPKIEPMIDGRCGFLYLDKNNMLMVALYWEKYNKIYKKELPGITPHVARHTFCSNMAKSGVNPKKLQYIVGHSDIGVTLNTYTHLQFEDLGEEMEKICEGKRVLQKFNLDRFINQTIDNLYRVIPNYAK